MFCGNIYFAIAYEVLSESHKKWSHLASIFVLSHEVPLLYFLFGRHICLFLFMSITFEIVYTCVSIQNTKAYAYETLSDIHKYFIFGNHICSFTSMTTEVFLTWQTYLFLQIPMKL